MLYEETCIELGLEIVNESMGEGEPHLIAKLDELNRHVAAARSLYDEASRNVRMKTYPKESDRAEEARAKARYDEALAKRHAFQQQHPHVRSHYKW